MTRRRGPDGEGADRGLLAGVQLNDRAAMRAGDEPPRAARHDDGRRADEPERADVEVVVVRVRHEHRVDVVRGPHAAVDAPQVQEPRPQDGVREDADARRFDQDGAVAEPGDRQGLDSFLHASESLNAATAAAIALYELSREAPDPEHRISH